MTKPDEIDWAPKFFADEPLDEDSDSDDLRTQGCCTQCRGYTENLPGYYWTVKDECPLCRAINNEEKWSSEVMRLAKDAGVDEEELEALQEALAEYKGI